MTVKPAALSIDADDRLADLVDVAGDGAGDGDAERAARPAGGVDGGLQDGDRGLHRLGALDELGEEELAAAEEVADLLDALDVAQVEDVDRGQAGVEALLGELGSELDLAVDHGLLHLGVEILSHHILLEQLSSAAWARSDRLSEACLGWQAPSRVDAASEERAGPRSRGAPPTGRGTAGEEL